MKPIYLFFTYPRPLSLIELDLPFSLLNKPLWNECLCEKDYHIRLGELELRTCLEADANSTIKD